MNQQLNKYDSEFCGNLPIHLINVIQPYGALIIVDRASGNIIQVSENIGEVTGRPFQEHPGMHASSYLNEKELLTISDTVPHVWKISGKKYLAILHHNESYDILEINLESVSEELTESFVEVYRELKQPIAVIESTKSLGEAAAATAKELKKASGFDKVMIYRFDENWNGNVLAEAQEEQMESYLGFTFPASDIPRQARDLYLKNAYRLIPDRDYRPVKLYPFVNPATDTFIDLSDCNVRGVTSVHVEYLKNMQVSASMSTRIIKDGKLWGLIACHHQTPIQMNYKVCAIFEWLSGIISAKISSLENQEKYAFDNYLSNIYTSLVEETYRSSRLAESLLSPARNILDLFNAGGSVIARKGQLIKKGQVPEDSGTEDLLLWLNSRELDTIYYTDHLSKEFDYASDYKDVGSGLLVIPINPEKEEYVLLFRPEVVRVIKWGGDPEARINFEKDMKTYHPRYSFKLWQEKLSGVSMPWQKEEVEMAENLQQFIREFLSKEKLSSN